MENELVDNSIEKEVLYVRFSIGQLNELEPLVRLVRSDPAQAVHRAIIQYPLFLKIQNAEVLNARCMSGQNHRLLIFHEFIIMSFSRRRVSSKNS